MSGKVGTDNSHPLRFACIGAGRVAWSLLPALKSAGYDIGAIISRTSSSAKNLAERCEATVYSTVLSDLSDTFDCLLLCVPDQAVAEVAGQLSHLPMSWTTRTVAHTSGVLTTDALAALEPSDANLLSWHPLQTFPDKTQVSFRNVFVGMEGHDRAIGVGQQWADALGATAVRLQKDQKARYHLAAAIACNFLTTLQSISQEILSSLGIPIIESRKMLEPLVRSTVDNVFDLGPEDALTGPIARGDVQTIAMHLRQLQAYLPDFEQCYRQLALETLRFAERSHPISSEHADHIRLILTSGEE